MPNWPSDYLCRWWLEEPTLTRPTESPVQCRWWEAGQWRSTVLTTPTFTGPLDAQLPQIRRPPPEGLFISSRDGLTLNVPRENVWRNLDFSSTEERVLAHSEEAIRYLFDAVRSRSSTPESCQTESALQTHDTRRNEMRTFTTHTEGMKYVKKGDKLRVIRQVADHSGHWHNSWTDRMTRTIGEVGTVVRIMSAGVYFKEGKFDGLGYPLHACEVVTGACLDTGPLPDFPKLINPLPEHEFQTPYRLEVEATLVRRDKEDAMRKVRERRDRCYAWVESYRDRIKQLRNKLKQQMICGPMRPRWRQFFNPSYGRGAASLDLWRAGADDTKRKGKNMAYALAAFQTALKGRDENLKFATLAKVESAANGLSTSRAYDKVDNKLGGVVSLRTSYANRFNSGHWKRPLWHSEPWVPGDALLRLPHMSTQEAGMVAWYDSFEKFKTDTLTRARPGRFLTKFYSDVLSEKDIKYWAERQAMLTSARDTLRFIENDDPDGWEWVYEHGEGFTSCMTYDRESRYLHSKLYGENHPVRAYARKDNGLRLAYLGTPKDVEGGKVYARAIVRDDEHAKGYIRIYGDDRIKHYLKEAGYGCSTSLEGVELNKRLLEGGGRIICPYLDSGDVEVHRDYLEVVDCGRDTESTGLLGERDHYTCERCGADHDDEDDLHYSDRIGSWCDECEDITEAIVGRSRYHSGFEYEMVSCDDTIELKGRIYLYDDDVLEECGFRKCEECDEWEPEDDMTLTSRGYVCGCTTLVELATEDDEGNMWAHPEDVKDAIETATGDTVQIHEDTDFDEDYADPDTWKADEDKDEDESDDKDQVHAHAKTAHQEAATA